MIGIHFEKIIGLLLVLILLIFVFLLLLRRRRKKKSQEELEDLRKEFVQISKLRSEEASEEDMELLDRVVEEIERAGKEGKESVELSFDEDIDLRIEASDLISLRTPKSTLHKSFPRIKFRKMEELEDGVRLYLEF